MGVCITLHVVTAFCQISNKRIWYVHVVMLCYHHSSCTQSTWSRPPQQQQQQSHQHWQQMQGYVWCGECHTDSWRRSWTQTKLPVASGCGVESCCNAAVSLRWLSNAIFLRLASSSISNHWRCETHTHTHNVDHICHWYSYKIIFHYRTSSTISMPTLHCLYTLQYTTFMLKRWRTTSLIYYTKPKTKD